MVWQWHLQACSRKEMGVLNGEQKWEHLHQSIWIQTFWVIWHRADQKRHPHSCHLDVTLALFWQCQFGHQWWTTCQCAGLAWIVEHEKAHLLVQGQKARWSAGQIHAMFQISTPSGARCKPNVHRQIHHRQPKFWRPDKKLRWDQERPPTLGNSGWEEPNIYIYKDRKNFTNYFPPNYNILNLTYFIIKIIFIILILSKLFKIKSN